MSEPFFKRVLLKLSGEALAADKGFGVDTSRIHEIAAELADVNSLGVQIAIVVGGGNFFRGVAEQARDMDRVSADHMGMLATVINALALQDALAAFPADRVLVFVREGDAARYREDDVVGEAQRRFGVPVTEVTR